MNTAYTPGPWITHEPHNHVEIRTTDLTGNIALVFGTMLLNDPKHPINQTRDANARLIASAPALLEALQEAYCQFEHNGDESVEDRAVLDSIRLAIAQATGGEK